MHREAEVVWQPPLQGLLLSLLEPLGSEIRWMTPTCMWNLLRRGLWRSYAHLAASSSPVSLAVSLDPPSAMRGFERKLDRALDHLGTLHAASQRFFEADPCAVVLDCDMQTREHVLRFESGRTLPERLRRWPLIASTTSGKPLTTSHTDLPSSSAAATATERGQHLLPHRRESWGFEGKLGKLVREPRADTDRHTNSA